jgi:hypothetical protein
LIDEYDEMDVLPGDVAEEQEDPPETTGEEAEDEMHENLHGVFLSRGLEKPQLRVGVECEVSWRGS